MKTPLLLLALAHPKAAAASSSLVFSQPRQGQLVTGPDVTFVLGQNGADSGHACVCLQNVRHSFEAFTFCPEGGAGAPYVLRGVSPGVWRAWTYVIEAEDAPRYERGCHASVPTATAQGEVIDFCVDAEAWEEQVGVSGELKPLLSALAEPEAGGRSLTLDKVEDLDLVGLGRRMHVFGTVREMVTDKALGSILQQAGGDSKDIILLMFNKGHLPLGRNAISSLQRAGLLRRTVVFSLDDAVHSAMQAAGVASYRVPDVSQFCPEVEVTRDVFSQGFADLAVLKPASVLTCLLLGVNVLWMDTDVVVLEDPFPHLKRKGVHLSIQAPSNIVAREDFFLGGDEQQASQEEGVLFRAELCTGFYYASAAPPALSFWVSVVHALATWPQEDVNFGDQAATNLILFEKKYRGLGQFRVRVLDVVQFPAGVVYFETDAVPRLGLPVIVHNNQIRGMASKIARFEERGLWLESAPRWPPSHRRGRAILVLSLRGRQEQDKGRLHFEEDVLGRLEAYALKVGADLRVVRSTSSCAGKLGEEKGRCAKGAKVSAMADALLQYERVLLLDDTVLVRKDSPDLFNEVPADALGAAWEDWRAKPPAVSAALSRMACLRYGVQPPADESWFNSGVLLASQSHSPIFKGHSQGQDMQHDQVLLYDQGFVNAQRLRHGFPVHDVGYAFNWVGSFGSTNAAHAPMAAQDAFFVHVTSGLALDPADRIDFSQRLAREWQAAGL